MVVREVKMGYICWFGRGEIYLLVWEGGEEG